jgi:hypothetical protein
MIIKAYAKVITQWNEKWGNAGNLVLIYPVETKSLSLLSGEKLFDLPTKTSKSENWLTSHVN